jgi:hypothetical protein
MEREKLLQDWLYMAMEGRTVMDKIKRLDNTILSLVSTFYLTICYTKILVILII